jgi:spermidine synthase
MQAPYLILPVGIVSLIFYFLGLLFVKTGLLPNYLHRKIWNTILLVTFSTTAILGLLLAIQINYKIEWTIVDSLLKWHVDFGIAMTFTGIVHLIWHIRYYTDIFIIKKPLLEKEPAEKAVFASDIYKPELLILLSGFAASVIQVLLLREIITGLGASLGRNIEINSNNKSLLQYLLVLLGVVPVSAVILLNILKSDIFPPGILIPPINFILIIFFIFLPVCIIIGILYSIFIHLYRNNVDGFIKTYAYESFGSLAGGLLVSFIFIRWLGVLQSLLILAVILVLALYFLNRRLPLLLLCLVFLTSTILSLIFPIENFLKSKIFVNQNVIESRETYYENLTITENAGQYNFYGNGSLMFTTENTIINEEYVHYAMLQHPQPGNVLLISGGVSGMLKEILKYPTVTGIDYIETNPQLIAFASKYINFPDSKKIHVLKGDARRYIRGTTEKYDIVILAVPDPSNLQIYRFYTVEFMNLLKARLNPGGYILYAISPAGNYLSKEKTVFESSLYHSLKSVFKEVKIIPGEKDYHVASDSSVSLKIGLMSEQRAIKNDYVNSNYIDENSVVKRSRFIESGVEGFKEINKDEKPFVVFAYTLQFLSQFDTRKVLLLIIPLVIFLVPVFFMKNTLLTMYLTGMTASSVEILLIFIFQIVYGYAYAAIGIIIAIFMGGMALGSLFSRRLSVSGYTLSGPQILLAFSVLLVPLLLTIMNKTGTAPGMVLFFILNLIPAILTGFLYGICTRLMIKQDINAPIHVYSADLLGSALGVVAVTIIIFPLTGIQITCYVLAGLNILGAAMNSR